MQLDPYRLIYANTAANRAPLWAKFSEADRPRYLLALFRDGVYSDRVKLADGGAVAIKKAQ
ncbi:hypothetical protein [Laspinema palackyanum]|uniref:hypothetical protein n=1 Tax=Laspinema palackyanum TaxID=3231601 RepID=UPI00345CEC09|nr:hypothetical protein [Laspinema sp. D2c]